MDTQIIQQLLIDHQWPFIFLGSCLLGETVVVTAAFLAVMMGWNPVHVFLLSLAGTGTSDMFWFMCGRRLASTAEKNGFFRDKLEKLKKLLPKMSNVRNTLFYYKFLYGFRLLTIFYLASQKMRKRCFFAYNATGASIWLVAMIAIGWLAGKGMVNLMPILGGIGYVAPVIVILIIARRALKKWIDNKTVEA